MSVTARIINVEQAEVRTATVTVRALTIDGRQVTMALFRQLQEDRLVEDDGGLRGLPWGRVNYCPDRKACPSGRHFHVVWQDGDELRRATEKPPPARPDYWPQMTTEWLILALADGWRPAAPMQSNEPVRVAFLPDAAADCYLRTRDGLDSWRVRELVNRDLGETTYTTETGAERGRKALAKAAEELRAAGVTRESALGAIRADMEAERHDHADRWKHWHELEALPQLFIAT